MRKNNNDLPRDFDYQTRQKLRASLQRYIQDRVFHAGISFTQGAAEYLASRTAETLDRDVGIRRLDEEMIRRTLESIENAVVAISESEYGAERRYNKKMIARLVTVHEFCGIWPVC